MPTDKEAISMVSADTDSHQDLRVKKERYFRWQAGTAALCLTARAALLYKYTECIIQAQSSKHIDEDGPYTLAAYAFLLMETAFTIYRLFPQHIQSIQHGPKAHFRPRLWISGDRVPTVDVLIFYCGEDLDVLLDTVRAACSIDYPQNRYRVTVLDDSNNVYAQVETLKQEYPNLTYSARKTKTGAWHKAGNINHGLDYISSLPGGPNELVAGLDVDMIPDKEWLRRVVPHLLQDKKMGLVNPNQRFYNVPPQDPLGQLLQFDQMQSVRQIRRDFGAEGLAGGTGWVARRAALDSIGGFSVDGFAEDFLTCMDLREAGWAVALLDENLQWGLMSDSFNSHTKLYRKWMTVVLSFYQSLVSPRDQATFKIVAESSTVAYMIAMSLCYFALPLMVLSGQPFILTTDRDQIKALLTVAFVDFTTQSIHGYLESATADFNIYAWHEPSHLWHTPIFLAPFFHRFCPLAARLMLGEKAVMRPGGSMSNRSTEDQYKSSLKRLKILLVECQLLPHLFVLSSCLIGLAISILDLWRQQGSRRDILEYWIIHAGWPPVLFFWSHSLKNALKPFYYALFVPPRTNREVHLYRDKKSCLAYPTSQAKDQSHRKQTTEKSPDERPGSAWWGIEAYRNSIWPEMGPNTLPNGSLSHHIQKAADEQNYDIHYAKTLHCPDFKICLRHAVRPAIIVKAAIALFNCIKTGKLTVLIAVALSGRSWPFVDDILSHYLPDPKLIAGITISMATDVIHISNTETVHQMLARLDCEQALLNRHQHCPLSILKQLNEQDRAIRVRQKQIFNWLPYSAEIASSYFEHSFAGLQLRVDKASQVEEPNDEFTWRCGLLDSERLKMEVSASSRIFTKASLSKVVDDVFKIIEVLVKSECWNKSVVEVKASIANDDPTS